MQIQVFRSAFLIAVSLPFLGTALSATTPTTVLYQPSSVSVGPFPSNTLTLPDSTTRTGLRISLDGADESPCDITGHAAVCSNTGLLNQLDGFSLNPRIMVCFSAPVDLSTIPTGVQIIPTAQPGTPISLNQVTADKASNCVYGKPESILNQGSSYLLAVTSKVKDANGNSVADNGGFRAALKSGDRHGLALRSAFESAAPRITGGTVVSGTVFTTMNATGWLQDVRAALNTYPATVLPAGFPYAFRLADVKSIIWHPDNASIGSQALSLSALAPSVDSIAFGLFLSPNYLSSNGTITTTSTDPVPVPGLLGGLTFGMVPVSFHVFLPTGTPPPGGWPVAIYGHGLSDNQFGAPTFIAATLASQGIATLALEITGHGYGPNSTVAVDTKLGFQVTEATPGRGVQIASGTPIGPQDGCIAQGAVSIRDCSRQTAIDLFALTKTIRQTAGLGLGLNSNRIYYIGQSFGSIYGSLLHAVDPEVKAAVINTGGGTLADIARLAVNARPLGVAYLAGINPALLNVASGMALAQPYFHNLPAASGAALFNDGYVYRDQAPAFNTVPGAIEIQAAFEAAEWTDMPGDAIAYAPHFQTAPLAGVPSKPTLFQFGVGDLEVPNPIESALVRAANGAADAWILRFDTATLADGHPELLGILTDTAPQFPILPHRYLSNPTIFSYPAETSIALATQKQAAAFLLTNGLITLDPNTLLAPPFTRAALFQPFAAVPSSTTDHLNFIQIQP